MFRFNPMSSDSAIRRIKFLTSVLSKDRKSFDKQRSIVRLFCSSTDDGKFVRIGDISLQIKTPKNPELVPLKYLGNQNELPQSILKHLRWIMQKDVLGQDVFLIGPPGPFRRNVAMMYSELTKKEVEYVSLSRDTTETDLKQRREIRSGTAFHIDQSAVRAATEGRVLILEGIEKAERNVLPVLNNLLENREMQLDDGRFLMAADRYDKLLKDHTQEELNAWKLVRVNESFRVIALGLPVPKYQGNPLDPPLRSRFQARDVNPLPFQDQVNVLRAFGEGVSPEKVSNLLSFASTLKTEEATTLGLPDFPMDNMSAVIKIMNAVPNISSHRMLSKLYPYEAMLNKEGITSVKDALKSFDLLDPGNGQYSRVTEVHRSDQQTTVSLMINGNKYDIPVIGGKLENFGSSSFINTAYHDDLLTDMMLTHIAHDFCVIGPRGCGKSMLVKEFAQHLGYHIETIMLYQDMTSRDLLQQRMTLPNGDTAWRHSPLVKAALEGSLAVLDGVHRVNPGTFAVLQRLIHDRELGLFDGTRLLRHDRYEELKEQNGYTDEQMANKGNLAIDPHFRIVALAEPPVFGSSAQQWLTSELLTMFMFHNMRSLGREEELHVLSGLVKDISHMQPLMELTHKLRLSHDANLKSVANSLSTRQLLRIAKRLAKYPDEDLYNTVQKACLGRFLPRLARTALENELELINVTKHQVSASVDEIERSLTCEVKEGQLRIGSTVAPVYNPDTLMKVPDVLFYENPQHLQVMEDMLKDFLLGEHLLLVGNQGVGKNKIVDRFLHLLNRPREYLQLHRDTTVQTLTLQPTVQDGVIIYEDSPLVRAVKNGYILVVDEADKAPTNVTCILKTLVESGEMHLSDGRRIVNANSGMESTPSVVVSHPDFRMIVLANRPGFPFLGNDFFAAMGDIFSCHAVDNPDTESEMSMLRQYGPNVPEDVLKKLVLSFAELREMADQGQINYPYSTREVVNMVKHLEKFPTEGLANVMRNVFDFDSYNKELTETIITTLHKHGIPVGANPRNIHLAKEFALPELEPLGHWHLRRRGDRKHTTVSMCPVENKSVKIKGPMYGSVENFPMERTEARSLMFSEQEAFWTIPMHETSIISDVAVTKGNMQQPGKFNDDIIHVANISPICLYSMNSSKQTLTCIDLYDLFPATRMSQFRPRLNIVPLGFPLDNSVLVHEEMTNTLLAVNWENGEIRKVDFSSMLEAAAETITRNFRNQQGTFKMCGDFAHEADGMVLLYKQEGQSLDVLNMLEGHCHSISLPIKLHAVNMLSKNDWLLSEYESGRKYLLSNTNEKPQDYMLQRIEADFGENLGRQLGEIDTVSISSLHKSHLSAAVGHNWDSVNRLMGTKDHYAVIGVGLPEMSTVDIYSSPRPADQGEDNKDVSDRFKQYVQSPGGKIRSKDAAVCFPDSGQVVRVLPDWKVPKEVYPEGVRPKNLSGYLEVTDTVNKMLRYIPVPGVTNSNIYHQWYTSGSDINVVIAPMSNDGLVTVDTGGCVRLWETALAHLEKSIGKWRSLIGEGEEQKLQITNEKELGKEATGPKHGRVDPTGAAHVGGNQWAGGTGGRDTAGLGGIGGPYRLDGGHDVTQVSQWDKDNVPEEVKRAAREMGQKAYKERLKQIQMSEYDGDMYETYSKSVRSQVKSIRVILENLQAKGKERQWLKNQSYGDLDESKLIEGLTGERAIYKRRGEKEPELGSPQQKPKLVKLLCDVSGSMYRFNGHDARLEREMEAMLMVMEAFENYDHKIKYEIIGHSGEGYKFDMTKKDTPPKDNKQRLDVLKTLHAHSQFCISGDHTLEATKHAIQTIVDQEADERFVIVLSDANFERYGIRPKHFADVLNSNDDVNAYVIFIGSLGDQANRLIKVLPSGKAFMCMDTKNLPNILQQIFTSTMLS